MRVLMSPDKKIVNYLQDAQALEATLRRSLVAHIAVSARDEHRALLREHLEVTTTQERRIAERLTSLGAARNPVQSAVGAAKGAAALALTLAKGPADALRGPTGDDVALRNILDECASEALEIATYEALEILADEAGDAETAELARRHRAEEEQFLARLREALPSLARNVAENAKGRRQFPLSTIGAIDGVRALAVGLQTVLGFDGKPDEPATAAPAAAAAPRAAAQPKPPAQPASRPTPAPSKARNTAKASPTAKAPRPARKSPSQTPVEMPLAEYGDMSPHEISALLDHLPAEKLDEVERYERANDGRSQVLDAISEQRAAS